MYLPSTRRQFLRDLLVWIVALFGFGCASDSKDRQPKKLFPLASLAEIPVGVTPFSVENVAVIRSESGIKAVSLDCSHQRCQLRIEDRGFLCPCHGSTFTLAGMPTSGPAKKRLTFYRLELGKGDVVHLDKSAEVDHGWLLIPRLG